MPPPIEGPGTGLEDVPSDEDLNTELRGMADDGSTVVGTLPEEQAQLNQIGQDLGQLTLSVDQQLDAQVRMDQVASTGPQPNGEIRVTGEVGDRLTRQRAEVQELRDKSIRGADKKKVWYARWKFWSFVTSIVAATPGTLVFIYLLVIMREDPPELTEEQKEQIKRQAQRWRDMSDEQYWSAIADYCDRWNPSWAAQLLFMDDTQELKPLSQCVPPEWNWALGDDQYDFAMQLANAFGDQSVTPRKSGVLYRALADLTYAGDASNPRVAVPFPRWVAADTAKLAIAYVANAQGPPVPPSN